MGKPEYPGENSLVGCSANPMILILMRVSLPSKLRKTNKQIRERDTDAQTLSHNRTIYALIQYYGRLQ